MKLCTKFAGVSSVAWAGCFALMLAGASMLPQAQAAEEAKAAEVAIKGTCVFGGRTSTWSAKLTPKGDDSYDAVYSATWSGKKLDYVGTVKSDLKTAISGTGKASGGGANGNFEFAGKFGEDGVAKCNYKELGGGRGRSGTMTVDKPK
jgi:hypothetical protein